MIASVCRKDRRLLRQVRRDRVERHLMWVFIKERLYSRTDHTNCYLLDVLSRKMKSEKKDKNVISNIYTSWRLLNLSTNKLKDLPGTILHHYFDIRTSGRREKTTQQMRLSSQWEIVGNKNISLPSISDNVVLGGVNYWVMMSFLSLWPLLAIKHVTWLKINNWNSFGCIEKKKSRANNDETNCH